MESREKMEWEKNCFWRLGVWAWSQRGVRPFGNMTFVFIRKTEGDRDGGG